MPFRLPVRRFLQSTEKSLPPQSRFGVVQWVLSRPLYRFKTLDLTQVPVKSRSQALQLELNQWTPFETSAYYVGWHNATALVWAWDSKKTELSISAKGLKPNNVQVLPETVLQSPLHDGLAVQRCMEGFEGQLWREGTLQHSRWWPQLPTVEEWLTFQRDAAVPPNDQQNAAPTPRTSAMGHSMWIRATSASTSEGASWERLLVALGFLALWVPTLWFGIEYYKLHQSTALLLEQKTQLQTQAQPIVLARSQARNYLDSITALLTLEPYPSQLSLMATLAQAIPKDQTTVKDWDFQQGQLKVTLTSPADISTTALIGALQQTGPFRDVKALPGRDPKNVTFQMGVANATTP